MVKNTIPKSPIEDETDAPGYHVWSPENGMPRVRQPDLATAVSEAMRLSDANPGERFFVMAPVLEFITPEEIVRTKKPLQMRGVAQIDKTANGFNLDDEIPF